jgi:hypothetical protein
MNGFRFSGIDLDRLFVRVQSIGEKGLFLSPK